MDDWGIKLGRGRSGKESNVSKKKASGRRMRPLFSSEFKAKVALSALREAHEDSGDAGSLATAV